MLPKRGKHRLDPSPPPRKNQGHVYKNLEDNIDYALNVYKPLMDAELTQNLENHKNYFENDEPKVNPDKF